MKNMIIAGIATMLGMAAAGGTNDLAQAPSRPLQGRYAAMERIGGRLARPGSQKGCIRFVNAQREVPLDDLRGVEGAINKFDQYRVEFRDAEPSGCPTELARANGDAGVAVVVVSDDKASPLLVSPDEHWAVVNVKGLREGLMTDGAVARFLASRCRKQLIRAYVLACTGNGSQYVKNFFHSARVSEFDLYNEFVPMDAANRCKEHLARRGVTPTQYVSYLKAANEGWAPAPTNDIQKAIWDKVHEMPSAPIKIKPETKKVSD